MSAKNKLNSLEFSDLLLEMDDSYLKNLAGDSNQLTRVPAELNPEIEAIRKKLRKNKIIPNSLWNMTILHTEYQRQKLLTVLCM